MSSAVGVVAVKVANDSGQKVMCTGKEISKVKISCLVEGTIIMNLFGLSQLNDVEEVFHFDFVI